MISILYSLFYIDCASQVSVTVRVTYLSVILFIVCYLCVSVEYKHSYASSRALTYGSICGITFDDDVVVITVFIVFSHHYCWCYLPFIITLFILLGILFCVYGTCHSGTFYCDTFWWRHLFGKLRWCTIILEACTFHSVWYSEYSTLHYSVVIHLFDASHDIVIAVFRYLMQAVVIRYWCILLLMFLFCLFVCCDAVFILMMIVCCYHSLLFCMMHWKFIVLHLLMWCWCRYEHRRAFDDGTLFYDGDILLPIPVDDILPDLICWPMLLTLLFTYRWPHCYRYTYIYIDLLLHLSTIVVVHAGDAYPFCATFISCCSSGPLCRPCIHSGVHFFSIHHFCSLMHLHLLEAISFALLMHCSTGDISCYFHYILSVDTFVDGNRLNSATLQKKPAEKACEIPSRSCAGSIFSFSNIIIPF